MKRTILLSAAMLCRALCFSQVVSDFISIPLPDDIKVDRHSNVWVNYHKGTTPDTFCLAKVTVSGTITNVITEPYELGQFGVNDSVIWISSWTADRVYKYDHNGNHLDTVNMNAPTEILLDADGTWYVAQNQNGRILKVLPDNTQSVIASGIPFVYNLALARDEQGKFYTCNLFDAKVIKVNPETGDKTILATLPVVSPYSLGFLAYHRGNLYVPSFKNCIYKIDTAGGSYSIFAGAEGVAGDANGSALSARMNSPTGVAVSVTGDTLYYTDAGNNKVKMISGLNALNIVEADQGKAKLCIFPNPASNTLSIMCDLKNDQLRSVIITDMQGRVIDNIKAEQSTLLYQTNKMSSGKYIITGLTQSGRELHSAFVVP